MFRRRAKRYDDKKEESSRITTTTMLTTTEGENDNEDEENLVIVQEEEEEKPIQIQTPCYYCWCCYCCCSSTKIHLKWMTFIMKWKSSLPKQKQSKKFFSLVVLFALLLLLLVAFLSFKMADAISAIFETGIIHDPYIRSMIFNPIFYIQARFLIPTKYQPNQLKEFILSNETAFVINMDRDIHRLQKFQKWNPNVIQRFPAHEWIITIKQQQDDQDQQQDQQQKSTNTSMTITTDESTRRIQQQQQQQQLLLQIQETWQDRYPFIKEAAAKGKFGDAACSLSHVLLWQTMLVEAKEDRDYIYVFEDDVRIQEPLLSQKVVYAPDIADVIFLTASAMKRVSIPWKMKTQEKKLGSTSTTPSDNTTTATTTSTTSPTTSTIFSTRVIGGFGSFGYIITKQGALKMLEFIKTSRQPIDLAFFSSTDIQVYMPQQQLPNNNNDNSKNSSSMWKGLLPARLVKHPRNPKAASSRMDINKNK